MVSILLHTPIMALLETLDHAVFVTVGFVLPTLSQRENHLSWWATKQQPHPDLPVRDLVLRNKREDSGGGQTHLLQALHSDNG